MVIWRPDMEELVGLAHKAKYCPSEFARLLNLSEWQLHRRFHRMFKCTPGDWLAEQQLKKAKACLWAEGFAKGAAAETGFEHASNFCRWFKRRTGMTPTAYARRCLERGEEVAA